ncbi:prephenate dehydratase [Sporohalobacter salinus]|uniref:prephenate dehydratase n=1 Tax=Sporohalobacter salinus TaxID=1494606 RepID=UPI0019602EC4|nr:prephenate dehydratase [Sporohalobacter salinus]MBM7623203.1 prephenate dehydratase [Sporohalobacter salinus]
MKRLAYLGPRGTFTNEAAKKFIGNKDVELIPHCEIRTLVEAVANQQEKYGLVPIENSLEGSVNIILDLLAHKVDLKIQAEILMPINHNLIGCSGADLSLIEKVVSHRQALAQCRDNLKELIGDFDAVNSDSTAQAAHIIQQKEASWGAVGSRLVAELNGLDILASNIQDNESNWTRFVLLSEQDSKQTENSKTSLVCSPVKNRPGILYEILKLFAIQNINLTKIESRPARKTLGEYIFFIDFEGDRRDETVKEILKELEKKTLMLKILGSYRQFKFNEE